jgi:hypothetical protein
VTGIVPIDSPLSGKGSREKEKGRKNYLFPFPFFLSWQGARFFSRNWPDLPSFAPLAGIKTACII